jgi:PAS domain S-box-containing protein
VAVLAGSAVLAGWTLEVEVLKSFVPGLVAMNPVSALAFITLGVALWFSVQPPTSSRRLVLRACGGGVLVMGAVKLCEIALGSRAGVDAWLFPDAVQMINAGRPNRMAPNTALNFVLLGWAACNLDPRTRSAYLLCQTFQITAALTSLFALLGYVYGISFLYGVGNFNPMAMHTAGIFLVLGFGFCFARPDRGLASLMRDEGVGGITARRLLPAALLIPAGLGWLRLQGQHWGLYDSELGIALHVVVNVLLFFVLVWWSAVLLKRVDAGRIERASELSRVNARLREEVSERSRMQEALTASSRREAAMIENSIDMICTMDAPGRFASVSPACYKLLGYRSEELLGRAYTELVLPDDVQNTSQEMAQVMAGREAIDFENRCRRRDGRTVHLVWTAHWSAGEQLMFCVAHDNTERKRAEAHLQEARDYFGRIINSVPDPIFVKDRQHRCVLANDAFCELLGRDRGALVGATDSELFPAAQAAVFMRTDDLVFTTGQDHINEETLSDAQDHSRVILTRKRLYVDSRGDQFVVGVTRDITDRKRMESELEATRDLALESVRLKGEFLATMSHEIRTPMNAVIGMSDLLFETDLSESQRDYADTIRSSADALLTIINDILDFSKIEAGKLRFEKIDFDLHDAIDAPVEMLANRAQVKGLELVSFVHNDVPTALRGDPGRLRQVVTNLVGNAIKFTERGEIVVCVTREPAPADHVTLRFEITDTGIGIPEEARRLLFRPFIQGEGSTARKYGGTGLGLAISKQLVELMGGDIGVTGAPGGGSTFWFTAMLETQPQALSRAQPARGTSLDGVRVLIVDDNSTNRRILTHQTASWGMVAVEADAGAQALALLRAAAAQAEPFRVAILDLAMPVMDGFQLAAAVKSDEAIAGTRLVLMPAIGKRGHGEAARNAGISAYLEKPVRQSQLYACLVAVLADSAAQEPVVPGLVTRHSLREVAAVPLAPSALSSLRILVADDLAVNRTVATIQLRRLGHQADCVANGTEAVAALDARSYDLVLMDCQMPEMDGFEATGEIRRREGARKHTTIIAMTASALAGDREKCLAAGMDDYIPKPVKAEALKQMLERWVQPESEAVPSH